MGPGSPKDLESDGCFIGPGSQRLRHKPWVFISVSALAVNGIRFRLIQIHSDSLVDTCPEVTSVAPTPKATLGHLQHTKPRSKALHSATCGQELSKHQDSLVAFRKSV